MATSLRVLRATREEWSKELHDETLESHPLLAMLNAKKRVTYGHGGTKLKWTVKYKQLELQGYADMEVLTWARNNLLQTAELDYRGYKVVDAISELEKLQNRGSMEQVIDLFASKAKQMAEDANERIGAEFYVDGNAPGNEKRLHGIESFMGITPGSVTAADDFVGDTTAAAINDSYAGLTTTAGTYGGASATDPEYDFWKPTIVQVNQTGSTWAANCDSLVRKGIVNTRRTNRKNEALDIVLLTRADYRRLLEVLDDKERVIVDKSDQGIKKFGFTDYVNLDGVDVTFDPDIPTTDANSDTVRGYGFNTSKMELCLMSKKGNFWDASGDAFDESTQSFRFWIGFWGNLKFSPRHFVKFADVV